MSGPVTGHRGAQTRLLALPAPPHLGPRPSPRGDDAIVGPASTAARAPARHRGAATRCSPSQHSLSCPRPAPRGSDALVGPASTASRAPARHRGRRHVCWPCQHSLSCSRPPPRGYDAIIGPATTGSPASYSNAEVRRVGLGPATAEVRSAREPRSPYILGNRSSCGQPPGQGPRGAHDAVRGRAPATRRDSETTENPAQGARTTDRPTRRCS